MPGIPQLREAGRLYAFDGRLLATTRLFERMDGAGWDVHVADPASARDQVVPFPDEAAARAELERIHALGRLDGEWTVHVPDNPYERRPIPDHSDPPASNAPDPAAEPGQRPETGSPS